MSRTTRALATLLIAGRIAAGIGPVEAMQPTEGRALAAVHQTTEHPVVPLEGR